jgi:hypothetical protein
MARGRLCALVVEGVCNYDTSTTVAAHSNQQRHGKGMGIKASDAYVVYACAACHSWLDQGRASKEEKNTAFDLALWRMVRIYQKLVAMPASIMKNAAKDKAAAQWALERIVEA